MAFTNGNIKKYIAALLAAIMLFSLLPMPATYAAETKEVGVEETPTELSTPPPAEEIKTESVTEQTQSSDTAPVEDIVKEKPEEPVEDSEPSEQPEEIPEKPEKAPEKPENQNGSSVEMKDAPKESTENTVKSDEISQEPENILSEVEIPIYEDDKKETLLKTEDRLVLKGTLPDDLEVVAYPVNQELEGYEVLLGYVLEITPDEDLDLKDLAVLIYTRDLERVKEAGAFKILEDESLKPVSVKGDWDHVEVAADDFPLVIAEVIVENREEPDTEDVTPVDSEGSEDENEESVSDGNVIQEGDRIIVFSDDLHLFSPNDKEEQEKEESVDPSDDVDKEDEEPETDKTPVGDQEDESEKDPEDAFSEEEEVKDTEAEPSEEEMNGEPEESEQEETDKNNENENLEKESSKDVEDENTDSETDDEETDVADKEDEDEPEDESEEVEENSDTEEEAEEEIQVFELSTLVDRKYKVTVTYDSRSGIPEDVKLVAKEIKPTDPAFDGYIEESAAVVDQTVDDLAFACALDIYLLDKQTGEKIEPDTNVKVTIELISNQPYKNADVSVVHFVETDEDVSPQQVDVSYEDGEITFETPGFSVFVIQQVNLKKTIETSDGQSFVITVSYDTKADVPEDAEISAAVIDSSDPNYREYVKQAASKLTWSPDYLTYVKLLDISLVSSEDHETHYQPKATVDVSIEVLDAVNYTEDYSVVHFGKKAEVLKAETEEDTVSFETSGFSAYAIVQGPQSIPNGLYKLSSLDEVLEYTGDAYIGTITGFYLTDYTALGNSDRSTTGIVKTTPAQAYPSDAAAAYYFEAADGEDQAYIYCIKDGQKYYIQNSGTNQQVYLTNNAAQKTAFTVYCDNTARFRFRSGNRYLNMWNSTGGNHIAAWTDANDVGNYFYVWGKVTLQENDPYQLDGQAYGLLRWNDGIYGMGLMAEPISSSALAAKEMIVMSQKDNRNDKLFVPNNGDITMWTFEWVQDTSYALKAKVGGVTKYLSISSSGISLSNTISDFCKLKVIPGTGVNEGRISLQGLYNQTMTYANVNDGFVVGGAAGSEWLYLVNLSELTTDYIMPYSASKVSVSDEENVSNGSRIIIYTRTWNDKLKKYELYAVDHDGSLVRCYESGDEIQWLGGRLNTMLWNFVEYCWEGTNTPNGYYELYNEYSGKYIAPQISGGQILSSEPIGINLNGRQYGEYYSTILAWDNPHYAYAGLTADDEKISSVPISETSDFYFALVKDIPIDDALTEVPTVDHTQYGITMKIKNFNTRAEMSNYLGSDAYTNGRTSAGLLSNSLGTDGYPTASGGSLAYWFANAQEVNHLFVASTYSGTGYYEYDSTQNYARLVGNDFVVYKELGSIDAAASGDSSKFYTHGQFLPFNDIYAGTFTSVQKENLTTSIGNALDDSDPRKHERLYLVKDPDYYFGVEIEAPFTQTANGLDAWNHDIIYEFTGDDDFWLYVDGELVIDLGGIHDALPGTINYSTGEINVNGTKTTIYDTFKANYQKRNPRATQRQINAYLNGIFMKNKDGQYIFKDYTTHTMKIFYLERGGGASNLHMKFNLASVKPGQIILTKEISGTDKQDYRLAEYGYQIWYQIKEGGNYQLLSDTTQTNSQINVTYQNTNLPVKFLKTFTPTGGRQEYENVYFLTPGQTVTISVPDNAIRYKIVECGVNTEVYDEVRVNDGLITGTTTKDPKRKDFATSAEKVMDRPRVSFNNHVKESAIRTLTITKKLYDVKDRLISDDPTEFSFRLYLGNENESSLALANMQSYCVKDINDMYCRWNADTECFESIGKDSYDDLTPAEKVAVTFQTSTNGAISRIRAGYKVEVRGLLVGTRFKVEEQSSEIPAGYSFIKYVRDAASYIVEDGDTINSGIIRDNDSPSIEIRNRRGFGFTVQKNWSDGSFMETHGDIFFGVFVKGQLKAGTVKAIRSPGKSLYYYWDELDRGADMDDYEIKEVILTGDYTIDPDTGLVSGYSTVMPLNNGDSQSVTAKDKETGVTNTYDYMVSYSIGDVTGPANNVRTDMVTNSRHGILLAKRNWNDEPLAGAVFTLTDGNGEAVGEEKYVSDENGCITIAYINLDTEYTLTETQSPEGYHGLEQPIKFKRNSSDGKLVVTQGEKFLYTITQEDENQMACLAVKNRPFMLLAVKQNSMGEPLGGATFELRREVKIADTVAMDQVVMEGFSDLESTVVSGTIPKIDQNIQPGTYYLRETSAPNGFDVLLMPIRFTIGEDGTVVVYEHENATLDVKVRERDGMLVYTIIVINKSSIPAPTLVRMASNISTDKWLLLGAAFIAIVSFGIWKKKGRYTYESDF